MGGTEQPHPNKLYPVKPKKSTFYLEKNLIGRFFFLRFRQTRDEDRFVLPIFWTFPFSSTLKNQKIKKKERKEDDKKGKKKEKEPISLPLPRKTRRKRTKELRRGRSSRSSSRRRKIKRRLNQTKRTQKHLDR